MKKNLIAFRTGFFFLLFHDIHSFYKIINPASALKQYKTNISLNYMKKLLIFEMSNFITIKI
jgi:hypothetical protein